MKHTKGPWKVSKQKGFTDNYRIFAEYKDVASIDNSCSIKTLANANLIASAPELLEVCKNVISLPEFAQGKYNPLLNKIEQAIAKAEGLPK